MCYPLSAYLPLEFHSGLCRTYTRALMTRSHFQRQLKHPFPMVAEYLCYCEISHGVGDVKDYLNITRIL